LGLNLTQVFGVVNDLKKNLFFETDEQEFNELVFKNLNNVILTLSSGFYISKNSTSKSPQDNEERRCSIVDLPDDVDMDEIVKLTTSISYGPENYKLKRYIRPRGSTLKYKLLLEATGQDS